MPKLQPRAAKSSVSEAEKRLAEAFRKVEAEGATDALKAQADRLSRAPSNQKTD